MPHARNTQIEISFSAAAKDEIRKLWELGGPHRAGWTRWIVWEPEALLTKPDSEVIRRRACFGVGVTRKLLDDDVMVEIDGVAFAVRLPDHFKSADRLEFDVIDGILDARPS